MNEVVPMFRRATRGSLRAARAGERLLLAETLTILPGYSDVSLVNRSSCPIDDGSCRSAVPGSDHRCEFYCGIEKGMTDRGKVLSFARCCAPPKAPTPEVRHE